jgi:Peroxidase, family 2
MKVSRFIGWDALPVSDDWLIILRKGDGSIARNDAYTNHGDAHSLNLGKFEGVYAVGGDDQSEDGFQQRYTLDKFRARFQDVQDAAIADNPYYFTGAFSTIVVVPAAYNFVINFMSNHSASEPSGYLVRLVPLPELHC